MDVGEMGEGEQKASLFLFVAGTLNGLNSLGNAQVQAAMRRWRNPL
jgi:hypothetical protein